MFANLYNATLFKYMYFHWQNIVHWVTLRVPVSHKANIYIIQTIKTHSKTK